MDASNVIDSVRDLLQDKDSNNYRWSDTELIGYLNDALLQLVVVRPDVMAKTESIQLDPGTLQSIPTGAIKLLDIPRNMGADGQTPGYPVTPIGREDMDALDRIWHKRTPRTHIDHYAYDDKVPRQFYVTPPVDDATQVWVGMQYSAEPATLIATTDTLPVSAVYKNPLTQWVASLAYATETSATSEQRSRRYEQAFYNSLGIKSKVDRAVSPNPDTQRTTE